MRQRNTATTTMMVALCILLCGCVHSQVAEHADSVVSPSVLAADVQALIHHARSDNIAYDLVTSLTTEVGPRPAGTLAEERARQWAVRTLSGLGFQRVRVEPFEVPLWQRGAERAAIVSPFAQPLTVTALGGSSSTGEAGVQGPLVAFPTLQALKAAPAEDVAGRIVFIDEVMARTRDGSGYVIAVKKRREAALVAAEKGALAVLIRSVGTSHHRFAHTGQMRSIDYRKNPGVPAAALTAPDADQLRRVLGYGDPVVVKLVLTPRLLAPSPSGNVVADIPGSEAPEEIVLLGAHLDSWDLGTGAVDDGAGVGIVVAAAVALQRFLQQPPRRTVRIVLFGSEEVGLVGAKAYASAHADTLSSHVVATESDFGAGDIWRFSTRFSEQAMPHARTLQTALAPLNIVAGDNNAFGGPDMKYLREAGVPVVTLHQDGTDYFDVHHTANDTLNKIPPDALDQNVAAYAAFLYLVAQSDWRFR